MIAENRTTDLAPILLARTVIYANEGLTAFVAENPQAAAVDRLISAELYHEGFHCGFVEGIRVAKTILQSGGKL